MPNGLTIRTTSAASTAASRLVLGTAQLGMNYGVANRTGQPENHEAQGLVADAAMGGFWGFDTAVAYGQSESVLGEAFSATGISSSVRVVTKGRCADKGDSVTTQVADSLRRLRVPRLARWLLHDENQLEHWTRQSAEQAEELRTEGLVQAFGVSVYHPDFALRATEVFGLTAIQFPASPFDRRFLRHGNLERLAAAGAAVHVRSIYLQGLALMVPESVPVGISHAPEAVETLRGFCRERRLDRDAFCLGYVLRRTAAVGARVVIGLENRQQLARNLELLTAAPIPSADCDAWDATWPDDLDDLVLPYRWNTRR